MERTSKFNRGRACLLLALAVSALACVPAFAADPLGRLFTTPQQRSQLDELRQALPQGGETLPAELPLEEPEETAAAGRPAGESITLKGLVRRKDGASTAWINDSNTFEGDVATQYLRVESRDIHARGVDIAVPNAPAPVQIKVGETYDPATNQMVDLASPSGGREASGDAAPKKESEGKSNAPAPAHP